MSIYSKDKTCRLNVRINIYQMEFLKRLGGDRSLSDVIRMIIDSYMWGCDFNADEQINFDN